MNKSLFHTLLILSMSLTLSAWMFGQTDLRFFNYQTNNGLLHDVNHALSMDDRGYLWMGSFEGVSRFDGTEFVHFTSEQGILNPDVRHLINTSIGLFVYSSDGLVYLLNKENELKSILNIPAQDHIEWAYHDNEMLVQFNAEFGGTEFWICPHDDSLQFNCMKGFLKKNSSGDLVVSSGIKKENLVNARLYHHEEKGIFLLTQKGLFHYEGDGFFKPVLSESLLKRRFFALGFDPDHSLWLVSNQGLVHVKDSVDLELYPMRLPDFQEGKLVFSGSGKLFLLNKNRGQFYRIDPQTGEQLDLQKELKMESLPKDILADPEGNVWVATEGAGVFCIYDSPFYNYSKSSGLENSFIFDLIQTDDKQLLAGTKNGLFKLENNVWKILEPDEYSENWNIWKFGKASNGYIYMVTNSGIYRYKEELELCVPSERISKEFQLDENDHLGVFRDGFVFAYGGCEPEPYFFTPIPELEGKKTISCMFEDQFGRLWMGTKNGVLRFLKWDPVLITTKEGLIDNRINAITQDSMMNMWIATEGGLSRRDTLGNYTHYTQKDGLLSNRCKNLLIDQKGSVWVATSRGLHYKKTTDNSFIPFNVQTGLVADDINRLFLDESNRLWVATSRGISVVPIDNVEQRQPPPKLHLLDIKLNQESVSASDLNRIPFDSKLLFNYSAITFSDSRDLIYAYQLNEKGSWQETKNRTLTLTDLRPDDYVFRLKAKKTSSDWSEVVEIPFSIRTAWYKSWWFISSLVLSFLLLSYGFMYTRFRLASQREMEKTKINKKIAELELTALQSQMNPHFLFNSMNAIQHFIMNRDVESANAHLSKFARLMRLFLESSKDRYISLQDEIELLRLYVEMEKLCYDDRFDYQIEIEEIMDLEDHEIPTMIIQPFVENAINHGLLNREEPGLLSIIVSLKNDRIICEVKDNGVGRAQASLIRQKTKKGHKPRGLEMTKDRIEVVNYIEDSDIKIAIEDLVNAQGEALGTEVLISFPAS